MPDNSETRFWQEYNSDARDRIMAAECICIIEPPFSKSQWFAHITYCPYVKRLNMLERERLERDGR